ncbi:MAG: hypothetical protein KGI50_06700 [Patescibacteria group bacterium]|nr:hypothetical protein [Patescibacteria group bacterium]
MDEQTNLQGFAAHEQQRIADERKAYMEANGIKPIYKILVGHNYVTFADEMPRDNPNFKGKKLFKVLASNAEGNKAEYDIVVSLKNPLYAQIMEQLAKGNYDMDIFRQGTGISDTRYTVTMFKA